FGAKADTPSFDSYPAFLEATISGDSIYVPAGSYYLSKPLTLCNQNLYGDGMFRSFIINTSAKASDSVLMLSRTCAVEDINIGFDKKLLTGNELQGTRVGILTGGGRNPSWSLQRGSQINRVRIENVGTAIYSPANDGYESFSVAYTNMEIDNFTYRGIDFQSPIRTGNYFCNIYIKSDYTVDSMFNYEGEESETSIQQLNLEHTRVKRAALSLSGCRALDLSSIHIEGVILTKNDTSFIYLNNTSGSIGAVSVYYTGIGDSVGETSSTVTRASLFEIDNSQYDVGNSATTLPLKLAINTLHVKGLNNTHIPLHGERYGLSVVPGFKFFKRSDRAAGAYNIDIYNYVWYT
ncbi:MAG: glycosyl hydrolase family 28-related protein, partial [Clostridia bacterium]